MNTYKQILTKKNNETYEKHQYDKIRKKNENTKNMKQINMNKYETNYENRINKITKYEKLRTHMTKIKTRKNYEKMENNIYIYIYIYIYMKRKYMKQQNEKHMKHIFKTCGNRNIYETILKQ